MSSEEHGAEPIAARRKPYQPPRLEVFGDLNAMTKTVGKTGNSDGGKGNTKATQP